MTAKKCTKKRDTRADVVILPIQPIAFLMFSLSSRSWHVKPGFHMITAIAEKKKFSDRSDHIKTRPSLRACLRGGGDPRQVR